MHQLRVHALHAALSDRQGDVEVLSGRLQGLAQQDMAAIQAQQDLAEIVEILRTDNFVLAQQLREATAALSTTSAAACQCSEEQKRARQALYKVGSWTSSLSVSVGAALRQWREFALCGALASQYHLRLQDVTARALAMSKRHAEHLREAMQTALQTSLAVSRLVGLWSDVNAKCPDCTRSIEELQSVFSSSDSGGGLMTSMLVRNQRQAIGALGRNLASSGSSSGSAGGSGGNRLAKAHASRLAFHQRWGHCPVCEKAGGCHHLRLDMDEEDDEGQCNYH